MKMVKMLGSSEKHTLTVSNIAKILNISQPAATKHLKVLYDVGLIDRQRVGACVYYSIAKDGVAEYQRVMEYSFSHSATPCVNKNQYDCENCANGETCA